SEFDRYEQAPTTRMDRRIVIARRERIASFRATSERIVRTVRRRITTVIDQPPEPDTIGRCLQHTARERSHDEVLSRVSNPLRLPLSVERPNGFGDLVLATTIIEGPLHPATKL